MRHFLERVSDTKNGAGQYRYRYLSMDTAKGQREFMLVGEIVAFSLDDAQQQVKALSETTREWGDRVEEEPQ